MYLNEKQELTLKYFLKAHSRGKKHMKKIKAENAIAFGLAFGSDLNMENHQKGWRLQINDEETLKLLKGCAEEGIYLEKKGEGIVRKEELVCMLENWDEFLATIANYCDDNDIKLKNISLTHPFNDDLDMEIDENGIKLLWRTEKYVGCGEYENVHHEKYIEASDLLEWTEGGQAISPIKRIEELERRLSESEYKRRDLERSRP